MNDLLVDARLWEQTLDLFQPYAERGVEAGCFWYGHRGDGADHAVLVGIPRQINRPLNFEIPADALADLIASLPTTLIAVAQLHTHPSEDTAHSPWDDKMVISRKLYSLVLPYYGARPCDVRTVGIHAFAGDRWQQLDQRAATSPIGFYTGPIDTRS